MKKPKFRVRIVANKIDLLPKDASMPRVKGWIAREAQLAGLDKIKIMDVFPISCRLAAVFFFCCSLTKSYYLGCENHGENGGECMVASLMIHSPTVTNRQEM